MALTQRIGLAPSAATSGAEKPNTADWNAVVKRMLAFLRFQAELRGGEGIYAGGAADETELAASGANWPASKLVVYDDSGYPFFFIVASTAITFVDATATGTNGHLYAVIKTTTVGGQALGDAGYTDVEFKAYDSTAGGFSAPAHSLLLGTGAFSSGAWTAFTAEDIFNLPLWTVSNESVDRTFDADASSTNELADLVATLLADLATAGLVRVA